MERAIKMIDFWRLLECDNILLAVVFFYYTFFDRCGSDGEMEVTEIFDEFNVEIIIKIMCVCAYFSFSFF